MDSRCTFFLDWTLDKGISCALFIRPGWLGTACCQMFPDHIRYMCNHMLCYSPHAN